MRKSGFLGLLIAVVVISTSGCGIMEPVRPVARYAKSLFTFRGTDYADPTEEEDEIWITDAANEGRAGRPRERDPDPWWQKYVMSEKVRSIERNVGID